MNDIELIKNTEYTSLVSNIRELIDSARTKIAANVNTVIVQTYWHIGEYIVKYEQNGNIHAEYGKRILDMLSHDLTMQYGRGFSRSNVYTFRQFYITYPKIQTLSGQLSWSHYTELLKCSNDMERSFYEKQAVADNWSWREVKRQMKSMLFHRLALSSDREEVLRLAKEGEIIERPEDILREPYVFEFTGLPQLPPLLPSCCRSGTAPSW